MSANPTTQAAAAAAAPKKKRRVYSDDEIEREDRRARARETQACDRLLELLAEHALDDAAGEP
jgi:hypothetical protein